MATNDPKTDHDRMMEQILADVRETAGWTGRSSYSATVLRAMQSVQRHLFVEQDHRSVAYENRPLSIGHGQTISQPFIVAIMTELLDLKPGDRVLEIGTGSGYQAAVLAAVVADVWTIERNVHLAEHAQALFTKLGISNVHARIADGAAGWPSEAPFDGIIVTAAAARIPPALIDQLAPEGRLVIPVGPKGDRQTLYRCEKTRTGTLAKEAKLSVAFVPLITDL